jgi:hypothetical protein
MVRNTAISRRKLLKTILTLGAGGVFLSLPQFLTTGGVIHAAASDKLSSLEIFTEISRFVTLRETLDPDALQKMYHVFKDEPWSKEHATGIHQKITAALAQGFDKKRPALKNNSWKFTDGEKWFAEHLLTTWYVGIYYHQERPTQRVLYEEALMFEAFDGVLPIPYLENVGFGAWAEPPEGIE